MAPGSPLAMMLKTGSGKDLIEIMEMLHKDVYVPDTLFIAGSIAAPRPAAQLEIPPGSPLLANRFVVAALAKVTRALDPEEQALLQQALKLADPKQAPWVTALLELAAGEALGQLPTWQRLKVLELFTPPGVLERMGKETYLSFVHGYQGKGLAEQRVWLEGLFQSHPRLAHEGDPPAIAPYAHATLQERGWAQLLVARNEAKGRDAEAIDRLLGILTGSKGFQSLPPREREQLIWLIGGTNPLSIKALDIYRPLLESRDWAWLDAAAQKTKLLEAMEAPIFPEIFLAEAIPDRPSVKGRIGLVLDGAEKRSWLHFPDHGFRLVQTTAKEDGLYYPTEADILRVVGTLSREERKLVQEVIIPSKGPDGWNGAAAPGGYIWMYPSRSPRSATFLDTVFRHEMGHLKSFVLIGKPNYVDDGLPIYDSPAWNGFKEKVRLDRINISEYSNAGRSWGAEKPSELEALLESLTPDQFQEIRHILPKQMKIWEGP
jgi:hypothetical protein